MKKFFLILFILTLSKVLFSQELLVPPSPIYRTTYIVQGDSMTGTGFSIYYNDEEFLITASHLYKKGNESGKVVKTYIKRSNKVEKINTILYRINLSGVDIVILKPDKVLAVHSTCLELEKDNEILGQDIYFIGYPSFKDSIIYSLDKSGILFPLIRKAIFSGTIIDEKGRVIILLDGMNIIGFSGSPIIYYGYETKKWYIMGVISGYIPSDDGTNSGVIIGYNMNNILDKLKEITKH